MRKAEITVHLFQETRHIMPDRPAKNLHQYEFCVFSMIMLVATAA